MTTITMTGEDYDYVIAKAKAEEREACANLVDQLADEGRDPKLFGDAIRERKT